MSTAIHPVTSTSEPAAPAEGLDPVTSGASATPAAAKKAEKVEKAAKKEKKGGGGGTGPQELSPPPEFFQERIKIFDEYKAKFEKWVAGMYPPRIHYGTDIMTQNNLVRLSPLRFQMARKSKLQHGKLHLFKLPKISLLLSPTKL